MKSLFQNIGLGLLCLIGILYTASVLRGPQGIPYLTEKRQEVKQLQDQNADLAHENQRKRERIQVLEHDKAEQELAVRERLKMVHKGETTFIIPDKK